MVVPSESLKAVAIATSWPPGTAVDDAIRLADVVPLEFLYVQASPTVVGNGTEPVGTDTEADEAELVAEVAADAAELAPVLVVAEVDADPLELLHPVRARPAAAATANAPADRRTSCAWSFMVMGTSTLALAELCRGHSAWSLRPRLAPSAAGIRRTLLALHLSIGVKHAGASWQSCNS